MLKHLPIGFYYKCVLSQQVFCSFLSTEKVSSMETDNMVQMQVEIRLETTGVFL